MNHLFAAAFVFLALLTGCSSRPTSQGGDFQEFSAKEPEAASEVAKPTSDWPSDDLQGDRPSHRFIPGREVPDSDQEEFFLPRKRYQTIHL